MQTTDQREEHLASLALEPVQDDRFITAHYFLRSSDDIALTAAKIASHQSTAVGTWHEDSLVGRCSARVSSVRYLNSVSTQGIVALSFPLVLFGPQLYSGDILHIVAGAVQYDEAHHTAYLLDLELPSSVEATFPGPAFGPSLLDVEGPRIGTIIKPCTGLTLADYERIVTELVSYDELVFIKEDENFFPDFPHCQLADRVAAAAKIIAASGRDVVFAPHITAHPRAFFSHLDTVAQAGLRAVMFSETYYGGLVREARDYVAEKNLDLALYAHNGGIGTRTYSINRVVLDRLVRLDGADFRQTAPSGGGSYLRPLPWQRPAVERALYSSDGAHKQTICVRAGGLDQGNLLLNLRECSGSLSSYLFLMGSAINSIKNQRGEYDIALGMQGVQETLQLFSSNCTISDPGELYRYARSHGLLALAECIAQRYSFSSSFSVTSS